MMSAPLFWAWITSPVKSGVASDTPAFITTWPPPFFHSSTKFWASTVGASASLT